ncbi:hypothetical protein JYA61_10320 [Sphingomonas pseudosanguinis]|uniref:Dual OB-containing domain-containing protein n=2 Tax=Sphingomonas pseudosanguinis TaxID=413712 RepID=A0A7W6ACA2_9SPHN|nr:hypothetical protein [Sphingomonas pseudosanguinis]MBB3879130.1 hypothetical protein [Sphingomonas pseudosanguinis]MBN3537154.1 hypothetical protein [Sphingomonas pseudosanguinis]
MNVLIVGRTKMSGSARCIGGLLPDGSSVRLTKATGHWDTNTPLQVGQVWDIDFDAATQLNPPHVEDVIVKNASLVSTSNNIAADIRSTITPWKGSIGNIFQGLLGFTGGNNGYISKYRGVPDRSTWFWEPDKDLTLRSDNKHYDYKSFFIKRGLSYVGEVPPIPVIAAGTLVRVSLARWWRPDDAPDLEERCYLQLSGWF